MKSTVFCLTQVPFLSIGNDIGTRKVCKRGQSKMSGDYVIEEVTGDGSVVYRRLVFLSNQNIVQSEARLKTGKVHTIFNLLLIFELQLKWICSRQMLHQEWNVTFYALYMNGIINHTWQEARIFHKENDKWLINLDIYRKCSLN